MLRGRWLLACAAAVACAPPASVASSLCRVDLGDPALRRRCRAQLARRGYVHLPDFLADSALAAMLAEEAAAHRAGATFRSSEDHSVALGGAAAGDARLPPQRSSKWLLAHDQLARASPLRALYDSAELRDFVSAVVGAPLFRSADPMNAVHTNRYGPGDGLGWHFDNAEFFANLVLAQPPAGAGGAFEFAPRSARGLAAVRAALREGDGGRRRWWRGRRAVAALPELRAGSLLLFRGARMMHRVTPVVTAEDGRVRITAILNWATTEGGGLINEYTRKKFFGRALSEARS